MVGRVLANRAVVKREGGDFELLGDDRLTAEQVQELKAICDRKLAEYIARRGEAIWEHRRRSTDYISGTLRYEVLKNAKFRCELCGVPADERALEVDHITPRIKGGRDEISNLQALCYSCNAMKRDRDDTDFRAVRAAYEQSEAECPFCSIGDRMILLQNSLAVVVRDNTRYRSGTYSLSRSGMLRIILTLDLPRCGLARPCSLKHGIWSKGGPDRVGFQRRDQ